VIISICSGGGEERAYVGRSRIGIERQPHKFLDPFGFGPSRDGPNGGFEFLERSGQPRHLDERNVFAG